MIKSELVQVVAKQNQNLQRRDVERIIYVFFEEISKALTAGRRVELRGFGVFSVKNRPSRVGRNPKTGEVVAIEEKWVPVFKAGKELRIRLNNENEKDDF